MGFWNRQKKILMGFGAFLAFMFVCTLVSRAVYASKLPQVTVDTPRRMALDHTVKAEGIVHPGREYAVTALAGLRVRTVYANVGDHVMPETLLFDLDMEDLKQKIQEKELEIKKCQLQIASMEQNRSLDTQRQKTENERALEDYARADAQSGESLARAREDLEDAEDAYDDHKDHGVQTTPEEERKAQQEAYEEWVNKGTELQKILEDAKKRYDDALEEVKRLEASGVSPNPELPEVPSSESSEDAGEGEAGDSEEKQEAAEEQALQEARRVAEEAGKQWETAAAAYEAHMKNPMQKPDFSAEDAEESAWNSKKESLKDEVEAARRALEEAEKSRSNVLLEEERKVEDTEQAADTDSSLEVMRLELSSLQTELSAYKKVQDASGQVYPEAEGIVTRIQVSPGERVGDGAALVYADLTSSMQFQVSLSKEQKKYVNQGDTAELVLGSSGAKELKVDYVAENDMNPELYDARVFLPDGTGTIGQSGSFQVKAQSETFSCCIPLNALHVDSNQREFVYIVSERAGILGTELVAEQIYVKVLDRNDSYAAIEEGVIDRETELIVGTTEELDDRVAIRYKE